MASVRQSKDLVNLFVDRDTAATETAVPQTNRIGINTTQLTARERRRLFNEKLAENAVAADPNVIRTGARLNGEDSIIGGVEIGSGDIIGGIAPGDLTRPSKPDIPEPVNTSRQNLTVQEAKEQKPRLNPLFEYSNYTYGLSLHLVPPEKYNKMATESGFIYKNDDGTVLIASAGRRNSVDFQRNEYFNEDFHFETLKFTTVIGMNSRSRNANAIDVNFTLSEPYGFTLIKRLMQATKKIKAKSWMQIPFLLQIDFFGNSDSGNLMHPIPNQSKYIPIRIIGIKCKVTPKGAEYQVQAVPYNHQAYTETNGTTPAFFEVKAKTVGEFFSALGQSGDADKVSLMRKTSKERIENLLKEAEEEKKQDPNGKRSAELVDRARGLTRDTSNMSFLVGSYAAAMNSFNKQLVEHNYKSKPDTYIFEFDDEIARSEIVVPVKTSAARTRMTQINSNKELQSIKSQVGLNTGVDVNSETFTINAGTSIIEVINLVMRSSEYIRKQFPDPATEPTPTNNENKPIDWYKIIPIVEIGEFDERTETYSKKITYYIQKYTYYNSKFRDAPESSPNTYVKEYQYMFTGKNDSILNFDIDFDTMFYTTLTANRSKIQVAVTQPQPQQDEDDKGKDQKADVSVQDRVTHVVSGQADMPNAASPDNKSVLVNDFSKSTMSSSRGDMINVQLKIIGDPEFIKQDDIFYNPINNPGQKTKEIIDPKSNSLVFDAGEIFCLLEFRTPIDYNDRGLMDFENTQDSGFSGLYKVITVDNLFEKGQFTQTLELIRIFNQPKYDTVSGGNASNSQSIRDNRTEPPRTIQTGTGNPTSTIVPPPPQPNVTPINYDDAATQMQGVVPSAPDEVSDRARQRGLIDRLRKSIGL